MDEVKNGSLRMDVEELCHDMDRLDSEKNAEQNRFTSPDGLISHTGRKGAIVFNTDEEM